MFEQKPPPGWYPTPDGGQRYWDGSQWLNLPTPNPEPAANSGKPGFRRSKRPLVLGVVIAVLILAIGGVVTAKVVTDRQAEAAAAALVEQTRADEERAAREAAEAKAEEERNLQALERRLRAEAVPGIEESVKKMAEEHVSKGLMKGPILRVSCSPVQGGSLDDLDVQTTAFECFAANKDNQDGTMQGYYYNATMNWTTGRYTYGRGRP